METISLVIIMRVVVAGYCRSLCYSAFTAPPYKGLVLAVVRELAFVAVLVQLETVRQSLGIVMPMAKDVTVVVHFGVVIFRITELTKYLLRRREARAP